MGIWRTNRFDLALLGLASVLLVMSLADPDRSVRFGSAGCAVALLILLLRDRRPPTAAIAAFALIALGMQAAPKATGAMFFALLVTFAAAGTLSSRRSALVAWLFGTVALAVAMSRNPYVEGAGDIALTLALCGICWGAALLVTERGRQAGAALARAELAEAGRELDLAAATAHERSRIAGELHDIVSHGLSIVILQTVAARMALEDSAVPLPDQVERRLGAVEATARDALADMRRLLDLLRPDDTVADPIENPVAPAVGLAQLPALVANAEAAGLPVTCDCELTGPDLPTGLDVTAYRIVQEALTNALKHAPAAPTTVTVRQTGNRLEVAVLSRGARRTTDTSRGAGYGLVGMRQRAELYGASLTADERDGGFAVRACFPLAPAETA